MTLLRKCPRCHSAKTFRSRRRLLERLLMHLRPYRCDACKHRFYSSVTSDQFTF